MGLKPRPTKSKTRLRNWEDLQKNLDDFINNSDLPNPSWTIDTTIYSMPKDEIIEELVSNGYEVEHYSEDLLTVR